MMELSWINAANYCISVLKGILFVVMCQIPTPTAHVLSVDHRNDVLVSSVALIVGILGSHTWVFIDPIGGVLIALYITIVWCIQGYGRFQLVYRLCCLDMSQK